MNRSVTLAADVDGDVSRVFEILSTTQGQRGFWTDDCDVSADQARFGHYGFGEGYPEVDLGHTAYSWALILDRLVGYVASGAPRPFFPAGN